MKGKGAAIVRVIGSFGLTGLLVVGVPLLLVVAVGNPLPSSLPAVDEVRVLLTQNGEGFSNFLIGVLALLIWFIWVQLIIALVVEVVATLRQGATRRLPTAPGIQSLAARLVAGMTLAATLATSPVVAPVVGALSFVDVEPAVATMPIDFDSTGAPVDLAVSSTLRSTAGTATSGTATAGRAATARTSATLVLDRATELWDLADAAYGDGVSWKMIAHANAGRLDGAGRVITDETASVPAGTSIELPGVVDTARVSALGELSGEASGAPGGSAHVVRTGESMWTIAEHEVEERLGREPTDAEVAEYWVDVVETNRDVPSGDVNLIHPDDVLTLPGSESFDAAPSMTSFAARFADLGDAVPDPAEPPAIPEPSTGDDRSVVVESAVDDAVSDDSAVGEAVIDQPAVAATPAPPTPTRTVPTAGAERAVPYAQLGLAAFGMALLSGGIVGALRRRRDLQRRQRRVGDMARQPASEAAAFETALSHASSELRESGQGIGWRMLPAEAVTALRGLGPLQLHAEPSGRLHAVSIGDPSSGATPNSGPERRIELRPDLEVAEVAEQLGCEVGDLDSGDAEPGAAVVPTSLIVGTDAESGEAVLVDLSSAGALELVGDPPDVARFARTAVLDLAVSERADDLCVIAVEIARELDDLERVRHVDGFAEALVQAVRCGHAAPGSMTPVVVVAGERPDDDDDSIDALRKLGALLIAPGIDAALRLTITGDRARLWPADTSVVLAALDNDEYRAVAELVDVTSPAAMEPVDSSTAVSDVLDVPVSIECPVEAGPVEVKVLGTVEVAGASSFSSLKAVDVVAYLAFHRNGVDGDQIKTWVWPAFEPPTDKAFANVMSRARSGLGVDDDGNPYLSRAGADKTYRLDSRVTTDFDRFRAIVELADGADDSATRLTHLRQALDLIRGVPFTGGSASSFAWADNHVRAHVEFVIDETVHRCADLALECGDLGTARWAALKGLELVPGCEQCFRRRFLVAGAGNNRTELKRAMADLERTAAAELGEPEAVDTISGDLLELYHQLDKALVAGSA